MCSGVCVTLVKKLECGKYCSTAIPHPVPQVPTSASLSQDSAVRLLWNLTDSGCRWQFFDAWMSCLYELLSILKCLSTWLASSLLFVSVCAIWAGRSFYKLYTVGEDVSRTPSWRRCANSSFIIIEVSTLRLIQVFFMFNVFLCTFYSFFFRLFNPKSVIKL